ncbi:MAG TPA: diguanylate cyclase, partial [Spirochaetota bacterium]|nr:diguanylate cyclase [Spirochaetota bacterium]
MTCFIQTNSKFLKSLQKITTSPYFRRGKIIKATHFSDLESLSYCPDLLLFPLNTFNSHQKTLKKKKYNQAVIIFYENKIAAAEKRSLLAAQWGFLTLPEAKITKKAVSDIIKIIQNQIKFQQTVRQNSNTVPDKIKELSIDDIPVPILVCSLPETKIIFASQPAKKILEYRGQSLLKIKLADILQDPKEFHNLLTIVKTNKLHNFEISFIRKNTLVLNAIVYLKKTVKKQKSYLILSITDITDRKEAEKNLKEFNYILEESIEKSNMLLQRQAAKDAFTGLANRSKFIHDIQNDKEKTIFIINIDELNSINSAYGMSAGNAVLMQVASYLQENKTPSESI